MKPSKENKPEWDPNIFVYKKVFFQFFRRNKNKPSAAKTVKI